MNVLLLSQVDIQKLNAMHPRCVVCDKPVDKMVWYHDGMFVTFIAHCHGLTDTTKLSFKDMHAMLENGITGGEAFVGHKLIEESK